MRRRNRATMTIKGAVCHATHRNIREEKHADSLHVEVYILEDINFDTINTRAIRLAISSVVTCRCIHVAPFPPG